MMKKYWFVGAIVALLVIVWLFGINPASNLTNRDIKEVGLYSLKLRPSLYQMGYRAEDLMTPDQMSPEYNGIFTGRASEQVIDALKVPSRSHYTFKQPKDEDKLYSINVKFSEKEGYTFITRSLEEEEQGRFWAYKYREDNNGEKDEQWFIYINPKLGDILKDLRS